MNSTIRVLTSVLLVVCFHMAANAQFFNRITKKYYAGVEGGYRSHFFTSKSNLPQINRSSVNLVGGHLGGMVGTSVFRSRLEWGYYSSVSDISGTIDLYATNAMINFYPLSMINKKRPRIEPYVTMGMEYDKLKFYGYYLDKDQGKINYSTSQPPYLGACQQFNMMVGTGIEVKILDQYDFVHLFSEVKYSYNIQERYTTSKLSNTSIKRPFMIDAGVRFGYAPLTFPFKRN